MSLKRTRSEQNNVETRYNRDPKLKKRHSGFWNSTIDPIKQFLVLVLNCLSSDVTLDSSPRERTALDDDDVFGGRDPLVDEATRVEWLSSFYDFLLEFLRAHRTLLRSLNKQRRRRSAVANHNALENKLATGSTDVVLDRPELVSDKRL